MNDEKSCGNCASDAVCVVSRSECIKHGYFIRKPVAKEPAHISCVGCDYAAFNRCRTWGVPECDTCYEDNLLVVDAQERKNYTPASAPAPTCKECAKVCTDESFVCNDFVKQIPAVAPKVTDAELEDLRIGHAQAQPVSKVIDFGDVWSLCRSLGMKEGESILAFIRTLA